MRVRDGDGIHATQRIDLFEVVYLAHLRKKRLAHLLHCGVIDIGKTVPEDVALRCPDQEAPLANAKDRLGLDSVDVRFVRVLLANDVLELAACLSLTERRPCLACGGDGLPRIIANMAFIESVSCLRTVLCTALATEEKLVVFIQPRKSLLHYILTRRSSAVIASDCSYVATKRKSAGSSN